MARRSTLERGPQPTKHGGRAPVGAPDDSVTVRSGRTRSWRGGGGRWWVWVGRAIVWAVLIVVAVNGVRAIVQRETGSRGTTTGSAHHPSPSSRFPSTLAEAFAIQFGQVYLNFDQAHAGQRARQLAAFIPDGAGQQFGWNGVGRMQLQAEQVADIKVRDEHNALVQLLVTVNGKLLEFSVPIYATQDGMVVSGEPALLPPPARISPPASQATGNPDQATQNAFQGLLPSFFQAYAGNDAATLDRFITKGFSITGLGGTVTYDSIQSLYVPQGGSARNITVTVRWQLSNEGGTAPATLDVTYDMTWIYQGGNWSVESIRGSTQQAGQQQ